MFIGQLTQRFKMKASHISRALMEICSRKIPCWRKIINAIEAGLDYVPYTGKLSFLPFASKILGVSLIKYIRSLNNIDEPLNISDDISISLTKWLIEKHKISQDPKILEYIKLLTEVKKARVLETDIRYFQENNINPTYEFENSLESSVAKLVSNESIIDEKKVALLNAILSNVKDASFFRQTPDVLGFRTIQEYLRKTNPALFQSSIAICESKLISEERRSNNVSSETIASVFCFVEDFRKENRRPDITIEHAKLLQSVIKSCSFEIDLIAKISSFTCLHRFIPICIDESKLLIVEQTPEENEVIRKKLLTSFSRMLAAIKIKLSADSRDAPITIELQPFAAVYGAIKTRINPAKHIIFDNKIREKLGTFSEAFFALLATKENGVSR